MKKLYLFACCNLFLVAIIAQPNLEFPQNAPEKGDVMEIQFVSPNGLSHQPIGPDVSWDFSQLIDIGSPGMITAIAPAAAPTGNEFPEADMVLNMEDTVFTYVMFDENAAYYLGSRSTAGGYDVFLIYSDNRKYLSYPFSYNDAFADTYKGVSMVSAAEIRVSGTSKVTADSYGTLTLPSGTFTDVLRTTTVGIETDSIFVSGILSNVIRSTRTQYLWYSPLSFGPLFSLEILDASGVIDTTCYYTTTNAGIHTVRKKQVSDLIIFPNPAEDYLFVEFTTSDYQPVTISIVNQVGQVMISRVLTNNAGTAKEKIDIRDLPSGIYFTNISCECVGQLTKRLIIR